MDDTNRVEVERIEEFRDGVSRLPDVLGFDDWLLAMSELQEIAYGKHYGDLGPDEAGDTMMMNLYAITSEVVEMGDEMGWKPWSSPRGWINREAAINEAVDIMHFLANLLSHAQCTGLELTDAYKAKMLKNLQRQIDGYNVQVEKCGHCKRDLSEIENRLQILSLLEGEKIVKFCNQLHLNLYRMENN